MRISATMLIALALAASGAEAGVIAGLSSTGTIPSGQTEKLTNTKSLWQDHPNTTIVGEFTLPAAAIGADKVANVAEYGGNAGMSLSLVDHEIVFAMDGASITFTLQTDVASVLGRDVQVFVDLYDLENSPKSLDADLSVYVAGVQVGATESVVNQGTGIPVGTNKSLLGDWDNVIDDDPKGNMGGTDNIAELIGGWDNPKGRPNIASMQSAMTITVFGEAGDRSLLVPEPASLALFAMVIPCLLRRRRG